MKPNFLEWIVNQRHRKDQVGFLARQIKDYPEMLKAAEHPLEEVQTMNREQIQGKFANSFKEAVAEWQRTMIA